MNFAEFHHGLCSFIAIVLTAYCIYQFVLDPDVSNITLERFHESKDDIHPSITLCEKDPFSLGGQLRNTTIPFMYEYFIKGESKKMGHEFSQQLLEVDYDDLSASLNDIIIEFRIDVFTRFDEFLSLSYDVSDGSLAINKSKEGLMKEIALWDSGIPLNLPIVVSARTGLHKCYTFDIPMIRKVNIRSVLIKMNATRASIVNGGLNLARYYIMLTYPNQTMQVPEGKKIYLNQHHRNRPYCYKFETTLGAMEVFQRRDKSKQRCNMDWTKQDQKLMNFIIERVGCNPKHWKIKSELPHCHSVKQYKEINEYYFDSGNYMPPCRSIELLSITTKGRDAGWKCTFDDYLDLYFYLDKEMFYKKISIVPAYNIQSLIGNAGTQQFFISIHL